MTSGSHVAIRSGGGVELLPISVLTRRLAVDDLVRLHGADFAMLADLGPAFVHFHLAETTNLAGRRYAMLPIVVPGSRAGEGPEVLPVLDAARWVGAICEAAWQRVPLDRVTPEHFAHSLPHIRTVEALRDVLLARYAATRPGLTRDGVEALGCAVTRFRMDLTGRRDGAARRSTA